jgi:penicillin-binding protein 1A
VTTPLTDTPSLPIGATEVTVMDQAAGFAVFANGGKVAKPYVASEVRNSSGEVIYRHADEKPVQVLSSQVTADMNYMLNKVVEEGTARKAQIEGVKVAGKTGTTNGYRDAWFVGYTGNYVGAVWYGNDDHSPTNKMTGGSLPAMTWHEIMAPAHQGIELKPMPGLNDRRSAPQAAQAQADGAAAAASTGGRLSRRSFEVLSGLNGLFRNVETNRSAAKSEPGKSDPARSGAVAPDRMRAPGLVPVDVAEGARASGGFGTP